MENYNDINFDQILNDYCLNNNEDISKTIQELNTLAEKYEKADLVKIYNYILTTNNNPQIISEVIRLSDIIRDKFILPTLISVLLGKTMDIENVNLDDYVNARVLAAKAIANLKDTSAVNALLYCLNNKKDNYKIRFACADALGKIGDKYAVAPLIEVVKDENEKSVYLRESAASALGMLGDTKAIDSLVSILETKNGIIDRFTFLKERVLEALGKLCVTDNKRVFRALKRALSDDSPQIRINAIETLMNSQMQGAFDLIKTCLKDDNDEVKKNALIALYNMSDRTILDEIINNKEYGEFLKQTANEIIEEYETEGESCE